MKKKMFRNTVIFLVLVALLWGAYMYLSRPDAPEEITNIEIATCAKSDVKEIKIENNEGSFTLLWNEESEAWELVEYPDIPVYQVKASNLAYTVSSVYAQAVIEENAQDFEKYGLSEPKGIATVRLASGEERRFLLGNELSVGNDSYFIKEGDSTVYTVATVAWDDITLGVSKFFDMELPTFENENVLGIDIKKEGSTISIGKSSSAQDGYAADWRVQSPFVRAADNGAVENEILTKLRNLSALNVFHSEEAQMPTASSAKAVVTITLKEGSVTYYIGENTESGTYFGVEGSSLTYLASTSSFAFLEEEPFNFMDKTVKRIPIKEVQTVDITLLGNLYTLGVGDSFTLNGAPVSEEYARDLYATLISLPASGISSETSLPADEENIIVFHKTDGTTESIQLKEDGRNFLADGGEGIVFTLSGKEIDAIKEKLE